VSDEIFTNLDTKIVRKKKRQCVIDVDDKVGKKKKTRSVQTHFCMFRNPGYF